MAREPAMSSGLLAVDTAICAAPAILDSIIVGADNTNAATIIIYDNASAASGTVLAKIVVDATTTYAQFISVAGIVANNGLYADVSGTGAEFIVHFRRG